MTVQEIMTELQSLGNEGIKKILLKHGVKEPFFGVKIEHLKPIQKRIRTNYQLAKDLYATGNADAMYLAGLIADDKAMTKADLQTWVEQATSENISGYTVPWVTAGNDLGFELATQWINSLEENVAYAGWSTLNNWVALKEDSELDIPALRALLERVVKTINTEKNKVKKAMNGFIIALGSYVLPLSGEAIAAASKIGQVTVDMGDTACKLPAANDYIMKVKNKGSLGKKKKMVNC